MTAYVPIRVFLEKATNYHEKLSFFYMVILYFLWNELQETAATFSRCNPWVIVWVIRLNLIERTTLNSTWTQQHGVFLKG